MGLAGKSTSLCDVLRGGKEVGLSRITALLKAVAHLVPRFSSFPHPFLKFSKMWIWVTLSALPLIKKKKLPFSDGKTVCHMDYIKITVQMAPKSYSVRVHNFAPL